MATQQETATATIDRPAVEIPVTPLVKVETPTIGAEPETAQVMGLNLTRDQIELLKRTVAKGATDDELDMFLYVCRRTGLDPFTKQIHAMKRRVKEGTRWRDQITWQTGIDGLRLIAQRTGDYEGQTEPEWCGKDGIWKQVWTSTEPPIAARVGVFRTGFRAPLYAVAHYDEYVQTTDVWEGEGDNRSKVGSEPNRMWKQMPRGQLQKCSEALALRKAFPQELSGIYAFEEMGQARNSQPDQPDDEDDEDRSEGPRTAADRGEPRQRKPNKRTDPRIPTFPFPPFTGIPITDEKIGAEMLMRGWKWVIDGGDERAKKFPGVADGCLTTAILRVPTTADAELSEIYKFTQNPRYAAALAELAAAIESHFDKKEPGNGEDIDPEFLQNQTTQAPPQTPETPATPPALDGE